MITLQPEGRRIYFVGNTFSIKDRLRAAGATWDPDRKQWWLGSAKQAVAEQLVRTEAPQDGKKPNDPLREDARIAGKAMYKDKPYLLLWHGQTAHGDSYRLASLDGSLTFWAQQGVRVTVLKLYDKGRDPMTFGRLKQLREKYAQAKASGQQQCDRCGGFHALTDHGCYMCGCTKCDGALPGGLCEDD